MQERIEIEGDRWEDYRAYQEEEARRIEAEREEAYQDFPEEEEDDLSWLEDWYNGVRSEENR